MIGDSKSASGLSAGSQIDRYVIESELGSGGFATVYRATHRHTRRSVALKVLDEKFADNPDIRERFRREAEAGSAIVSKHVVTIYDWACDDEGRAFMVMELCEGEPLSALVKREAPIPTDRAVRLCVEVLHGLEAAHRLGIVHRDVKPSNIFLARPELGSEIVKVLDFGISKHEGPELATLTSSGQVMGSAGYMSPEQVIDSGSIDFRTDIYSVGVILFELLTGRRPFEAKIYESYVVQVATEVPPRVSKFNAHCPAALDELIASALSPAAKDRPRSAQEFIKALEGLRQEGMMPEETVDAAPKGKALTSTKPSASPHAVSPPSLSDAHAPTINIVAGAPLLAAPANESAAFSGSGEGPVATPAPDSELHAPLNAMETAPSRRRLAIAGAVLALVLAFGIAALLGDDKTKAAEARVQVSPSGEASALARGSEVLPVAERYYTSQSTGPIVISLYRHSPKSWTLKVDGKDEVVLLTPMKDPVANQPWLDADGVQWILEQPNRLMFTGPGNPRSYGLPLEPVAKP